jgi:hypothetical protein
VGFFLVFLLIDWKLICLRVGYLFQALSVLSYVFWAAPTNVPVNQLFGVRSGMGMGILTFDWSQISRIGG